MNRAVLMLKGAIVVMILVLGAFSWKVAHWRGASLFERAIAVSTITMCLAVIGLAVWCLRDVRRG